MKKLLYFLLSASLLAMFGCTGDETTNSGIPNPNTLVPTGHLQGKLVDTCTQQPIAGAVIDIGIAKATTNTSGVYVLQNVPATTNADGTVTGAYEAVIDLRNATNAAGTKFAAGTYPEFIFNDVYVVFSHLDDAGPGQTTVLSDGYSGVPVAQANASNHQTPITGIMSGEQNFYAGKLAAAIKGKVLKYAKPGFDNEPAVGYFVKLVACDCSCGYGPCSAEAGDSNSTTGYEGNVVKTTTTGADGSYVFSGIESGRKFKIVVTDTDTTSTASSEPTFTGKDFVCAGCDNTVKYADTIITDPVSEASPCLVGVSPAKYSNIKPDANGNVVVTFTFNKAIAGNSNNGLSGDAAVDALALTSAGNPNSLFANVAVNFLGVKSSNVAFKLAWINENKTLQVTIPNASPASIYSVDISRALSHCHYDGIPAGEETLADAEGWTGWKNPPIDATDCCDVSSKVKFYTFGASDAQATALRAINGPYDYDSGFTLSWLPAVQAKAYNVYCRPIQNYGTTQEKAGYVIVDQLVLGTTDTFGPLAGEIDGWWKNLGIQVLTGTFVENGNIKITYDCYVAGVNADGTEGAASNVVEGIADTVKPMVVSSTLNSQLAAATTETPMTTFTVIFNEPMNKAEAEKTTNYVFDAAGFTVTPPAITDAVCQPSGDGSCRTVVLTTSVDPATVNRDLINTGANGVNESFRFGDDVQVIPAGQGVPNSACVSESATAGTAQTAAAGDDVQVIAVAAATTAGAVIINSGPDGVCNTTAVADDVQTLPVGQGTASAEAINAGPNFILESFLSGDDAIVNNFNVLTVTVPDVAGNALNTLADQIYSNGGIH